MQPPTLNSARHIRDGGIDAIAALNAALEKAIVGLSHEDQDELKRAFGHVPLVRLLIWRIDRDLARLERMR